MSITREHANSHLYLKNMVAPFYISIMFRCKSFKSPDNFSGSYSDSEELHKHQKKQIIKAVPILEFF